jgi:hypothetical protein
LAAGIYRQQPYWAYVMTEGVVDEVTVRTDQNRAVGGCVVAYRYSVRYRDQQGQAHVTWHEQSAESRTCQTNAIKTGDLEQVYYHPQRPGEAVQYPTDTWGAALFLFGGFGALTLLGQWAWGLWQRGRANRRQAQPES